MALITFPDAAAGALTSFLSNIRYENVRVAVNDRVIPITGTTTGGTADTLKRLASGFNRIDYYWSGTVEVSGTQATAQSSTLTHATVAMHSGSWSIGRSWNLQEVTGSSSGGTADSQARWWPETGRIFGNARGFAIATGPLVETATETLTIKNNLMSGTAGIAGTAYIQSTSTSQNFKRGGAIPIAMSYEIDQDYAHDATGNGANFSAILGEDVTAAPRTTGMAVDLGGTGENRTGIAAYLYYFEVSTNFRIGGPLYVQGIYREDHP